MTAAGFEQPSAASFAPGSIITTGPDVIGLLPEPAASKMTALKQRARDLRSAMPEFADVRELAETKVRHQQRIQRLLAARAEGGFALSQDAASVQDETRKLKAVEKELQRVEQLREVRGQRWTVASQLERRVSEWLTLGGIPHGCVIESVADPAISELLTKNDGGRIDAAVQRLRLRSRELAADAHRVRSAPHRSKDAKAAAKAQIELLAAAGEPNCDSCIEHGSPVGFATTRLTTQIFNVEAPAAIGFSEIPNTLGLIAWAFRDELLRKIDAAIDAAADDKAALDEKTRAEMLATISADYLAAERGEVSLIWHAEAQQPSEVIAFRPDTSPESLLGIELVHRPFAGGRR